MIYVKTRRVKNYYRVTLVTAGLAQSDVVISIASLGFRALDLVARGVPSPSTELELPPTPGSSTSMYKAISYKIFIKVITKRKNVLHKYSFDH